MGAKENSNQLSAVDFFCGAGGITCGFREAGITVWGGVLILMMAKNWSIKEVALIVGDYFDMLIKELSGQSYNKSEHRRNLQNILNNRSEGSIEFKHQNISAVLIELGLPYISGYKPRSNYQHLLKAAVEDYLAANAELEETINQLLSEDIKPPESDNFLNSKVEVPEFTLSVNEPSTSNRYQAKRNYYREELRNRKLGLLGEEFVISYEKQKLITLGKESLADKVEHISQTKGDSAGFDVLSFNKDGNEQFIEVKTTQMGKESPFYFTRNELGVSQQKNDKYNLYRVFNFKKQPKFYQLKGALDESCESVSTQYMGWPK
ncbi:DUF3883 domain-containing protein [Fodinibius roseus]|nr:DUF3883 domain-containing protein [Fodinibius roseus]